MDQQREQPILATFTQGELWLCIWKQNFFVYQAPGLINEMVVHISNVTHIATGETTNQPTRRPT